jgi:hypothetical protein
MSTKLTTITGQYHSYAADQVLTHYQLNETIDYFDDQNRLNRVFLIGTGIVCGLQVSTNPGYTTVTITQGNGITTDGDLIKLTSKPYTSNSLKQKLASVDLQKIDYKSYKPFNTDKADYAAFKNNSNALLPILELLPEKGVGEALETGEQPLTSLADLKNYVVLLYVENYTKEASLCDEIDCSNLGSEEIFILRALLVTKANANIIIGKNGSPVRDTLYNKYDVFQKYNTLTELGVKKVIPTFNSTSTSSKVKQLFFNVVNDAAFRSALVANLNVIIPAFGYASELPGILLRINTLFTIDQNNIPSDIHYRYDLLKDIVATYKELKDLFIQIKSECNPPIGSFPKHLFLGLVEDNNRYKDYRHQFYKGAAFDQHKTLSNFDSLFRRLKAILNQYQIASHPIKITPSRNAGKLGTKSIPYYYNVDGNLLHAWDFEKGNLFIHQTNFSYHTANLVNNDFIKTPLAYCIDEHDFYRIEGYLSNNVEDVKTFLNTKRLEYGLDFDFLIMDVTENAADLKILFNTNYAFEHKAGVKKGGTLLLLKSGSTFLTDFAIDGKIKSESGLGCCTITGCLYPWLSSLKYINNLSRATKGTPETSPVNYKLRIVSYSINNVPLINASVVIEIPMEKIFLRRLHVVMETLNNYFPTGLLFDFIEEEKKVKIMKLHHDTFKLELKDITFDEKSPVYTYTEKGISRNGKDFSSERIRCSIVNTHNPEIYKKIHSKYAPVDKDDDYGKFDEEWDRWYKLRKKVAKNELISDYRRFITRMKEFRNIPANNAENTVYNELLEIKDEIVEIDRDLNRSIYIGGDWTNGNWVNSTMYQHYTRNKHNTNDDIVLFIDLRKKLFNKTNTSKYIIHIDANNKTLKREKFASLIHKYRTKAEFYFSKPANSGNFVQIKHQDEDL